MRRGIFPRPPRPLTTLAKVGRRRRRRRNTALAILATAAAVRRTGKVVRALTR